MSVDANVIDLDKPTDELQHLINNYRQYSARSVKNILEMATVIINVEESRDKQLKDLFYKGVELDQRGSKVRKLKVIGAMRDRFEPHLNRLPNTWTTLYKLASLTSIEFQKALPYLHTFSTAGEIANSLTDTVEKAEEKMRITLDVKQISVAQERKDFMGELMDVTKRYGVRVERPKNPRTLEDFFGDSKI